MDFQKDLDTVLVGNLEEYGCVNNFTDRRDRIRIHESRYTGTVYRYYT